MRKKLAYLSAVLVASVFATSAQAAITISGSSGTFGEDNVVCPAGTPAPCTFTQNYEFVTPVGFNIASISVQTLATANPLTNIDFSTVTFNGVNFNNLLGTGTQELRNLLNQSVVPGATNRISVNGTTGGDAAFNGTIQFASMAAVPEPTTWMLMLMGMAGIGFSMRRKEKQTLRVRYA